jgi:hypothetical protein
VARARSRNLAKIDNMAQLSDPKPSQQKGKQMWEEFKKFAMRGNVVDLAVGVIIGAAFGAIVNSLVAASISPTTTPRYRQRCRATPLTQMPRSKEQCWDGASF